MRCGCVINKLIRHDRLVLALFWCIYAFAAATWVLWDIPKSLVSHYSADVNQLMQSYHHWGQVLILLMTLAFPLLALRNCFFRKKTEKGLRELAQGVSSAVGDSFFHSLCKHLSKALEVDYVIIGRLGDDTENRVDTVVAYADGAAMENFTYSLTGTPCEAVFQKSGQSYQCNVRELFPEDPLLHALDVEGYSGTPLFDSTGRPLGLLAVLDRKPIKDKDFVESLLKVFAVRAAGELERKQAETALREKSSFLQTVLNAIPAPIFFKDREGRYTGCNQAFETYIGLSKEKVIGETVYGVAPSDLAEQYHRADQELLAEGGTQVYEASVRYADGNRRTVMFHKAVFSNGGGSADGLVGTMVDITERKNAEEKVKYLAHFDTLTGLPNQLLFTDRLNLQVAHSHRLNEKFAVFNLDIDHFKKINNAFGHSIGDDLLKLIASRLTEALREDDTVAKMGGDSFILLLPDIQQAERAAKIARKILDSFKRPFKLEEKELFITASIGIAIYPSDSANPQLLLKNADTALQRAKEGGRNDFQFYTPQMNARAQDQLSLENQLRKAIEREEFIVHYQPQVDAENGELSGVEALVRWQHPELGMVAPARFIPLAEENGAIVPIGELVLRSACRQAKAWQQDGIPPLRVSVNLSPRQFQQRDFVKRFDEILAETDISPSCIGLEITESAVMVDPEYAVRQLELLKQRGVRISIDDFGTGYSSLGYLKRFPIDMLKIDRSFITDLPHSADDIAIVQAVIAMAHNLNLKVLAEGVETEAQRAFLKAHGCDEFQGFLFGRPLPPEDLAPFFEKILPRPLEDLSLNIKRPQQKFRQLDKASPPAPFVSERCPPSFSTG